MSRQHNNSNDGLWGKGNSASNNTITDFDVAKQAVLKRAFSLARVSEELKHSRQLALEAVKQNGLAFKYVEDDGLRHDKEIIFAAIKQNPLAFAFVDCEYFSDKKSFIDECLGQNVHVAKHMIEKFKENRDLLHHILRQMVVLDGLTLKYVPKDGISTEDYKKIALAAVEKDHNALQYVVHDQLDNKEAYKDVIRRAVEQRYSALGHIDYSCFSNQETDDVKFLQNLFQKQINNNAGAVEYLKSFINFCPIKNDEEFYKNIVEHVLKNGYKINDLVLINPILGTLFENKDQPLTTNNLTTEPISDRDDHLMSHNLAFYEEDGTKKEKLPTIILNGINQTPFLKSILRMKRKSWNDIIIDPSELESVLRDLFGTHDELLVGDKKFIKDSNDRIIYCKDHNRSLVLHRDVAGVVLYDIIDGLGISYKWDSFAFRRVDYTGQADNHNLMSLAKRDQELCLQCAYKGDYENFVEVIKTYRGDINVSCRGYKNMLHWMIQNNEYVVPERFVKCLINNKPELLNITDKITGGHIMEYMLSAAQKETIPNSIISRDAFNGMSDSIASAVKLRLEQISGGEFVNTLIKQCSAQFEGLVGKAKAAISAQKTVQETVQDFCHDQGMNWEVFDKISAYAAEHAEHFSDISNQIPVVSSCLKVIKCFDRLYSSSEEKQYDEALEPFQNKLRMLEDGLAKSLQIIVRQATIKAMSLKSVQEKFTAVDSGKAVDYVVCQTWQ